jgi:SOS response regulatory protein OraA/RecX
MTRRLVTKEHGPIGGTPFEQAWRRAVRLLAASEKTRSELSARLRRAGFDGNTVRAVIDDLTARRWLSDSRLALAHAEREVARLPAAAGYLEAKLESRGVRAPLARKAARAALAGHDESQDAHRLARQIARRSKAGGVSLHRKILAALARRGFDESLSIEAAFAVAGKTPGDED